MQNFYSRKSPRAQRYDYSSAGIYFVTICTQDRVHYFGEIVNKKMVLSDIGRICDEQLQIMLQKRKSVKMHEYIVMPNHIHLLFWMGECKDTGLPCPKDNQSLPCPDNENRISQANIPTNSLKNKHKNDQENPQKRNQTLGSVIGGWKSAVSKQCKLQGLSFSRQSRYHDHIVHNEKEYLNIRYYIHTNPEKRQEDTEYTD